MKGKEGGRGRGKEGRKGKEGEGGEAKRRIWMPPFKFLNTSTVTDVLVTYQFVDRPSRRQSISRTSKQTSIDH